MVDIAVIDYGMGNLRSVHNALSAVAPDASVVVTSDPAVVARAARVVFPGQGAMPDCMRELDARGLRKAVLDAAQNKPFLGICIGLQMLFEHSTEGDVACLGVLPGEVVRFEHDMHDAQGNRLKVPHMGWNQVHRGGNEHVLWQGIAQDERFYFVHSYYVKTHDAALVQARTNYPEPFVSAVARANLFAVQFHPEKSHTAGLQLLKNFVSWNPC
jgi:glutamine amidotransferase